VEGSVRIVRFSRRLPEFIGGHSEYNPNVGRIFVAKDKSPKKEVKKPKKKK